LQPLFADRKRITERLQKPLEHKAENISNSAAELCLAATLTGVKECFPEGVANERVFPEDKTLAAEKQLIMAGESSPQYKR
jgi:hypothetical protein